MQGTTPFPQDWKASSMTDHFYLGRVCRHQLCPSDFIGLPEVSVEVSPSYSEVGGQGQGSGK